MTDMNRVQRDATARLMGVAAIGGYCVHAAFHLTRGAPQELLWVCHLAAAAIGVGLITRRKTPVNAGTLVLCMGTPLWLLDLAQGGEFFPSSLGTHALGLAIGVWGTLRLGPARGAWWKAAGSTIALIGVSRWVMPAASNVNLAFTTPPGMDRVFPSHAAYLATMIAIASVYFFAIESVLFRVVGAAQPKEAVP